MSQLKPLSRKADIVVQEFANEALIYDLTANRVFNLNQTSNLVWQLADGQKTISEIAAEISRELALPVTDEFVWLALEKLGKEKLIENEAEVADFFAGITRRELIKKVGLTTLAAFPLVLSIVAPQPSHAASVCAAGNCRCPNASTSCNGSTASVGGVSYINCLSVSGNISNCDCVGPFAADNSAGTGFKASTVGCSLT